MQAIIFGTDVPGLSHKVFEAAVAQLDTYDVVLGPSKDGGYYMVGMKKPQPAIFQDVQWSTPTVLLKTLNKAREYEIAIPDPLGLPELMDIDLITVRKQCCHGLSRRHYQANQRG